MQQSQQVGNAEQLELTFVEEPSTPKCGSCGVEIVGGELCDACEQAFSSVLAAAPAPPTELTTVSPDENDFGVVALTTSAAPISAADTPPVPVTAADPPVVPVSDETLTPAPTPAPMLSASFETARGNRATLLTVAAVMVMAVVGVPAGARWLQNQRHAQLAATEAAANAAPVSPAPAPAPHRPKPAAPAVSSESAVLERAAVPSAAARPTPPLTRPRASRTPAKPATPAAMPEQPAPPVASPSLLTALAPVMQPPPPAPPAAEPMRSAIAEAPAGRFFEPSEVDDAPRIATRVTPQLPADISVHSNDVVVVRILVSHTGHPFRINLLRRSRFGPAVDDAVVAAVKHWTFSPAHRRGEAVSCWYNFGVTLGGN